MYVYRYIRYVFVHTISTVVIWYDITTTGRLRVNMGNIYFEQKKYPQAVKMYRMALDQIQNVHKDVRCVCHM